MGKDISLKRSRKKLFSKDSLFIKKLLFVIKNSKYMKKINKLTEIEEKITRTGFINGVIKTN